MQIYVSTGNGSTQVFQAIHGEQVGEKGNAYNDIDNFNPHIERDDLKVGNNQFAQGWRIQKDKCNSKGENVGNDRQGGVFFHQRFR